MKEFLLCLSLMLARFLVFGLGAHWFINIYRPQWLKRFFILGRAENKQVLHDIKYSLSSVVVYAFNLYLAWLLYQSGVHQLDWELSHYFSFALSLYLMMLLHDTWFFWTHWLLHRKPLFKRFHWVHHLSTSPTPLTSISFHPVEAFLESLFVPLSILLIPIHPYAWGIYWLWTFVMNAYGHSGLEFYPRKVAENLLTRFNGTSTYHYWHHQYVHCHYSLYFQWWDKLLGSLHPDYKDSFMGKLQSAAPKKSSA